VICHNVVEYGSMHGGVINNLSCLPITPQHVYMCLYPIFLRSVYGRRVALACGPWSVVYTETITLISIVREC
jgi:hypothetical protein